MANASSKSFGSGVLGIETSCDETGVALYMPQQGVVAERLYSQARLHALYGGVVPELASRDHIRRLIPLVREVLTSAGVVQPDAVAFTAGPGLIGALHVGAAVGRSLAFGWGVPSVGIHHLEGHLLAPMLEAGAPEFPFVALLVSGGHTLLIDVEAFGRYRKLGESLDDAAGEAFDKTAKMLGLPYPGGAELAALACHGDPGRFRFPRPMTDRSGLDFSFSGLKTYAINTLRTLDDDAKGAADVARAFEDAVIDTLVIKCRRALAHTGRTRLVVAGGVSANRQLRQQLQEMANNLSVRVFFPRPEYCTDNGAMIAYAGYCRLRTGSTEGLEIRAMPRWPLASLSEPD